MSGRERERETKEGHSPASDESERGVHFKKVRGQAKVKERQNEGGRTQGRKQCAPLILVKIQQTLRASGLAHFYCSMNARLPHCFSH